MFSDSARTKREEREERGREKGERRKRGKSKRDLVSTCIWSNNTKFYSLLFLFITNRNFSFFLSPFSTSPKRRRRTKEAKEKERNRGRKLVCVSFSNERVTFSFHSLIRFHQNTTFTPFQTQTSLSLSVTSSLSLLSFVLFPFSLFLSPFHSQSSTS